MNYIVQRLWRQSEERKEGCSKAEEVHQSDSACEEEGRESRVKESPESALPGEPHCFPVRWENLALLFMGSLNFFTMLNLGSNLAQIVLILHVFSLLLKAKTVAFS